MIWLAITLAGLTPAPVDKSFSDLASADVESSAECSAIFDHGRVDIVKAFNKDEGTLTNVAVITGSISPMPPPGSRLWINSNHGPAYRALILEPSPGNLRLVTSDRFVGDLFASETASLTLWDRQDDLSYEDAIHINLVHNIDGFRQKLATMMDCGQALAID